MSNTKVGIALTMGLLMAGSVQADSNMGRTVGVTCAGCHGTDGVSQGAAPSLKGKPAAATSSMLKLFKAGTLPASIMNRIAKGYTDEQIDAVAKYYETLK